MLLRTCPGGLARRIGSSRDPPERSGAMVLRAWLQCSVLLLTLVAAVLAACRPAATAPTESPASARPAAPPAAAAAPAEPQPPTPLIPLAMVYNNRSVGMGPLWLA